MLPFTLAALTRAEDDIIGIALPQVFLLTVGPLPAFPVNVDRTRSVDGATSDAGGCCKGWGAAVPGWSGPLCWASLSPLQGATRGACGGT